MNILVIGAHPDDEILGLGGTLIRHTQQGDSVSVLLLTDGHTARYRDAERAGEPSPEVSARRKCAEAVSESLAFEHLCFLPFPDQRLDGVPTVEIVQEIEKMMSLVQPDVVYVHHRGDVNTDHQVAFQASLTATRSVGSGYPSRVLCYETISSTEWGAPFAGSGFLPNVYVDISSVVERKLEVISLYSQELREFPHPRSLEGLRVSARRWGSVIGVEAAEAFVLVREVW